MVTITALCRATLMQLQEIIIPNEAANLHLYIFFSRFLVLIKKKSEVDFPLATLIKIYCDENLYYLIFTFIIVILFKVFTSKILCLSMSWF